MRWPWSRPEPVEIVEPEPVARVLLPSEIRLLNLLDAMDEEEWDSWAP